MKKKPVWYLTALLVTIALVMGVIACGGGGGSSPTFEVKTPTKTPEHPLRGFEDCLECHKEGPGTVIPADHASFTNKDCTVCHKLR